MALADRAADRFGRFVRDRSDRQLRALMDGWRRGPLLWAIFRFAPRRIDREAVGDERALVEIRIRDERRGQPDRRQLLIGRGRCTVARRGLGEPDSVVSFEGVSFLRFAAGQAAARELFVSGRLSVDGSLLVAAELPSFFRFPEPDSDPG
jgi:putative sterol carrier protein